MTYAHARFLLSVFRQTLINAYAAQLSGDTERATDIAGAAEFWWRTFKSRRQMARDARDARLAEEAASVPVSLPRVETTPDEVEDRLSAPVPKKRKAKSKKVS